MNIRKLGQNLTVSALGLGCMGMSEFYGPRDDAEALVTLNRALALGVGLLDTADMYGHGHNEELIGRCLKGRHGRDRVIVATKFGIVRPQAGIYERRIDNSPAYARRACEASLQRLGVETIDLYYVHRLEAGRPVEEVVGALADLVRDGKVRAIGLCEPSAATLRRAYAVHPIAAVQSEYSLWSREPEEDGVLDTCRELGIGFVAYAPVGRGFLTGTIAGTAPLAEGDMRRSLPRFQDENLVRNLGIVGTVRAMAAVKGCTPAQLALTWVLHQAPFIVPIPGTRRVAHLEENVTAARIRLSQEEMATLDQAMPFGAASGDRYTEEGRKGVGI